MLRISSTNLASGNFLCTFGKRWRRDGKMFTVMSFGPEFESRYITSCQNTIKWSMTRFPHLSSFRRNSTYTNRATEKYVKLRNREHPMQKSGRQRDGNKAASILNCHVALDQNDPNRKDEKQIHSGKTKSLTSHTERKTPSRRLLNNQDDVEDSSASSSEKTSQQTEAERFKTLEQIRNTIKINSNFKMLNSEEMQSPATGMNQARMKVRRLGTSKAVSDNAPSDKADKAFTQFQKMLEVPVSAQMEQFLHEQEIRKKCAPKTKRSSVNVFKVSDPYVKQRLLKNKVNVEIYNQTHLLNEKEPQCEFAEVQCGKKKLYIAFLDDDLSSSKPQQKTTGSSPPATQRKKSGKSLTNKFMHMTSSQRAKVTPEKMAKIIQDSSGKKGKIIKMIEKLPKAKQGKQRSGGHDKTLKFRIPHKEKNIKVIVNLTKGHNEKSLSPPVIHLLQKTQDGSVGEVLKFQIRKIEKYWFPTENGRIKIQYLTGALSNIKSKLMDEIPRMLKPQTVLEQDQIYQNYRQEDDGFYSSPLVKPLGSEMSTGEGGMTGKHFRGTKPLSFKRGEKEEPCMGKGTESRTFFRVMKDTSKVNRASEEKNVQDNTLENSASRKFISFENLFQRMGVKSTRDTEKNILSEVKNPLEKGVRFEKTESGTVKKSLMHAKKPEVNKEVIVFQNELKKSKSSCKDMPLNSTDLQSRKLPKVAQPAFKEIEKISKEKEAELSQAPPPPQLLDPYFAQVNWHKIRNAAHSELECPTAPPVKHRPQRLENDQQSQSMSLHPCKLNPVLSGSQSQQTVPRQTGQYKEPEQHYESEVPAVDTHAQVIPSNLERQNASKQLISPQSTIPLAYNHENALPQVNHPSQNSIPQNQVEYHLPKEDMQSQQQHSDSSQQSDKAQPEVQTEQCGGEQQEKPEDLSYQENSPRLRSKDFYYPKITSRKLKTSRLPAPSKMNEVTNFSSMFKVQEHKLIPFNAEVPPIYLNKDIQMYEGLKETHTAVKNECNEQATISVSSDNNSSIDKSWETWKKEQKIPNLRNMIRRSLANSDVVHSFIIETDTLGDCYSAANKLQEFVPKTAVEYNCKYDQEPELKTLENAVAQNFMKISDLDIIQLKDTLDWEKKSCDTRQTSLPAVKPDCYSEIAANSQSFVDVATDVYMNAVSCGYGALTVSLDQYQASGSGYSYQVQTKVTSWEDSFVSCNSLLEPHVQEAVESEGQYRNSLLPRKLEDDVDTITTTRTVQPSEIVAILNEEVMEPMSRSKSSKSTPSTSLKQTTKTATLSPWQTPAKIHSSGATFKSSAAACATESIAAEKDVRDNISENETDLGAHIEKIKETDETITEKPKPNDNPTSAVGSDPLKKQKEVVKSDANVKPTESIQNLKEELSSRLKSEWNIKDCSELTENVKPLMQTQISPEKRNNRLLVEKFALKREQTEVNKQIEVAENLEDYLEKDLNKVLREEEPEDLKLYHKSEIQPTTTDLEKQLDKGKQRGGGCYYGARYGCEKKVKEPVMVGELSAEQNLLAVTPSSINTTEIDQSQVLALEESSSAITMNQKKSDSDVDHLPRKDHPYLPSFVDPPQRDTTFTPQKPRDKDHPYLPNWETNPKQPSRPPQQPHTYPYYYTPPNTEPHPSYQPQHPQQPSYRPQQPETQPPQQPPTHPYYQQPQTQPYYHPQHPQTHPYYQQPQIQPYYQPQQPHTRPNYQPQQPQTNPGQQPPKHDKQEQSPPTRPTHASSCLDQIDRNLNSVSKCDLYSPEFQVEGTIHMLETEFGKNMGCATMQEMVEIDEYNLLGVERQDGILKPRLNAFDPLVSIAQDGEDLGNVNNHKFFDEFKPDVMREEKKFVQGFVMEPKYGKPGKYSDDHKKFKAGKEEDEKTKADKTETNSDKAGKIKLKELPPAKPQIKKRSEIKTFEVTLKGGDKTVDDSKKSEAGDKARELMQAKTNQDRGKGEPKKEVAANREGDAKEQKKADSSKSELRNLGMKKGVEEKQEDMGIKRKLGLKLRKEKEVAKDLESRKKTPDTLQEKTKLDVLEEIKRQEEQTKLDEKREQKQKEIEEQRAFERRKMEEERRALQIRMAQEAKRKAIEIFGYGTREHEELPKTEPSKGEPPKVELKISEKLETSPVIPIPSEKKPEDTKDKVAEEKKIKFPSPDGTSEKKTAGKLEQSNAAENPVKNATMKERFGPGLSKKLKSLLEERIEKHSTNLEKKIGEPKKSEEAIKISDEEKNRIKTPDVDKKVQGGETKKAEKEGLKSEVKMTPKEEVQKTEIKKPVGKSEEERKNELGKRKSNLADWEKELLDKTSSFFRFTAEPEKFGEPNKSAENEKAKKPEEKPKEKLAKSEVLKSDSPLKIDKDNKPENVPKVLPDKSDGDTSSDKSPKMACENDSLSFTNIEPNHYLFPPEYEESTMVAPVTLPMSIPTMNLEQYNDDQFNFAYKGDSFNLYLGQEEWEEMLKLFEKSRAIPAETPGPGGNKEQDGKLDGVIGRCEQGAYGLANTVEKGKSQHRKNAQEATEGGFGEFTKGSAKAQKNIMNHYQSPYSFTNELRLSEDVHCWSQKTTNNTMNAEYAPINEIYVNPTLEQMNIIPMLAAEETLGGSEEKAQTSESDSNVSILKKVFENDKTNNDSKDVEAIANDQRAPGKTLHSDGTHQQELRSCIEILKNVPSSEESEKKLIMERRIPVGTEGARSKKEIAESELNPYDEFMKMTTTEGENEMNQTNTENMQGSSLPGKDVDFKLFIELLDRTIANTEKEIRTGGIIQDEQNAKERSGVGQPELSTSEEVKKNYQLIRFLQLIRSAMDAMQNEMNQKWNSKSGAGDTERNFDSLLAALGEAKGKSEQKGLDNPSSEEANALNKKMQKSYKSENQQYNYIETEVERKGKSPRETEQKGKRPIEQQDLTDSSNEGETRKIIGNMAKKEEMLPKKVKVEEEKEAEETKKSSEVEKFKSEFNTRVSENQPVTGQVRMTQLDIRNVEEITEKKKATKGQKITEEERRKVITTKVSQATRAQEVAAKKRENRLKLEELEEKVKRREMEMNSTPSAFTVSDQCEDSSESFKVHNVEIIVEEPTTVQYDTSENAASANMAATEHESQEETGVKEFTVREEPFDIEVISIGQRPTIATVTEQATPERAVRPTNAAGKRIARTIIPNVTNASEVRSARNYSVREEENLPVQQSMKETEEPPKTKSTAGKAPTGSRKTALKIIGSFMQKRDLQTLSNADIYSLRKESRIPNRPVMLKLLTNKSNEERPAGQSILGESLRNRIASLPLRKTKLTQPEKEMATIKDNTELKVVRVVQQQQEGADGASKKSKVVPCAVAVDPENSTPERQ